MKKLILLMICLASCSNYIAKRTPSSTKAQKFEFNENTFCATNPYGNLPKKNYPANLAKAICENTFTSNVTENFYRLLEQCQSSANHPIYNFCSAYVKENHERLVDIDADVITFCAKDYSNIPKIAARCFHAIKVFNTAEQIRDCKSRSQDNLPGTPWYEIFQKPEREHQFFESCLSE